MDHQVLIGTVGSLAKALAADAGASATVHVIDDRPAVDTPLEAPVVRALIAAHRVVTGTEPVIGGVPGTTDGTILSRDAGLPTVVYGPGGKWIAHQADEYVEVSDIFTATAVFTEAATRFLESGGAGR